MEEQFKKEKDSKKKKFDEMRDANVQIMVAKKPGQKAGAGVQNSPRAVKFELPAA